MGLNFGTEGISIFDCDQQEESFGCWESKGELSLTYRSELFSYSWKGRKCAPPACKKYLVPKYSDVRVCLFPGVLLMVGFGAACVFLAP